VAMLGLGGDLTSESSETLQAINCIIHKWSKLYKPSLLKNNFHFKNFQIKVSSTQVKLSNGFMVNIQYTDLMRHSFWFHINDVMGRIRHRPTHRHRSKHFHLSHFFRKSSLDSSHLLCGSAPCAPVITGFS